MADANITKGKSIFFLLSNCLPIVYVGENSPNLKLICFSRKINETEERALQAPLIGAEKTQELWEVESFSGEFEHFFIPCTIIVTVITEFDQIS